MKDIKTLKKMLLEFSKDDDNLIGNVRNMFDEKLITYQEKIALREYVLDNPEFRFPKRLTIESAKRFLKDNGYFTDNLWTIEDVKIKYVCNDIEAENLLKEVFDGARIKEEINETIDLVASMWGLTKIINENHEQHGK